MAFPPAKWRYLCACAAVNVNVLPFAKLVTQGEHVTQFKE